MLLSSGSRDLVVEDGAPLGKDVEREFGTVVEVGAGVELELEVVPLLVSVLVTALLRIR
jgi:hypothetical protein